jgi:hypothetical protein
MYVCMYVCL